MAKKSFTATLVRPPGTGTWTYLDVPFSVPDVFGVKGQAKVKGTIDRAAFRSTLLPRGDGTHYLVVNRALRDQIGVSAGGTVRVTLERDAEPRAVSLAPDFKRALNRNRAAKAAYEKMAYSHQKAYVEWIDEARREDTRARRIEAAVKRLIDNQPLKK
jgi:hypothetical protein